MNQFTKLIAAQLNLKEQAVENTLALLEEGCTIPFISRYRKEKTGNMDEVNIEAIAQANEKLSEMAKRKETILKTIEEQGKLSDELKKRIEQCWDATELEDIYLPYKPKRRTRAQIAREAGLEPLAQLLLFQRERNPEQAARKFVGDKVKDVEAALQGAKDIIAETVSENEQSRNQITPEASFAVGDVLQAGDHQHEIWFSVGERVDRASPAPYLPVEAIDRVVRAVRRPLVGLFVGCSAHQQVRLLVE